MMKDNNKRTFWHLTFIDILTILCAAAVPIALGIYTGITYKQEQDQVYQAQKFNAKQATDLRRDAVYDKFLKNIYNLDKDGYLNETQDAWAFVNAYYRAAHRQLDPLRRVDVLEFLKEKELIGKSDCTAQCLSKKEPDIIRLNELDFDNVELISQTGRLNGLNLTCVPFDQVSMTDATISYANLNGASFDHARLNNVKFDDVFLRCASFDSTDLRGTDFGNSDLTGAQFSNVDLSTAKLTPDQIKQAKFHNTTMPDGTKNQITKKSSTTTKTTTTKNEPLTTQHICSTGGIGLTFDDLENGQILSYGNINWENAYVYTKDVNMSKLHTGVVSGQNAMYNLESKTVIMKSNDSHLFTLYSAAATAVYYDNLHLIVVGYNASVVIVNNTFFLNTATVSYLTFNGYSELDRVTFSPSNGTQTPDLNYLWKYFTMDDICLTFI